MSNHRGGRGDRATTQQSKSTEQSIRKVCKDLAKKHGLVHKPSYSHSDFGTTPSGRPGCIQPDGGFFLDNRGNFILAVEAKHQGPRGNAIERWYKNHYCLRKYIPKISYLTFGSGCISLEEGRFRPFRSLVPAHIGNSGKIGSFSPQGNSLFLKESWTEEEVLSIVEKSLLIAMRLSSLQG
jgi:hypothetical protein